MLSRIIAFTASAAALISSSASAAVVSGKILLGPAFLLPSSDYQITTYHDEVLESPYDAFMFSALDASTFQIDSYTLGSGITLYILAEGMRFGPDHVGSNPPLASNYGTGIGNTFPIDVGHSVLLGICTEAGSGPDGPSQGDWFGWIRIFNDGASLTSEASATASGGLGIVAGTLIEIPEPAAPLLFAMGLCGMLRRRR